MYPQEIGKPALLPLLDELYKNHHIAQTKDELTVVYLILQEIVRPKVIVEIGTFAGGWAAAMATLPGWELIVTVDRAPVPEGSLPDGVVQIVGDSHDEATKSDLLALLDGREVDVLHIDGDHSRAGARKDWDMYNPLVLSGGVIIFHDLEMAEVRETFEAVPGRKLQVSSMDGWAGTGMVFKL